MYIRVVIDLSNVVLKTERLILRVLRKEDLDDFYELFSDKIVGKMADIKPFESKEEASKVLQEEHLRNNCSFTLEYNHKMIGILTIKDYSPYAFPEFNWYLVTEIGYALARDYWGQGFMPEAVKEVSRHLFEEEELDYILAGYFEGNEQSKRVQEKCGYVYCKTLETTTFKNEEVPIHFTVLINERIEDER